MFRYLTAKEMTFVKHLCDPYNPRCLKYLNTSQASDYLCTQEALRLLNRQLSFFWAKNDTHHETWYFLLYVSILNVWYNSNISSVVPYRCGNPNYNSI